MRSDRPPFIFVHIKKTGGTAITAALADYSVTPVTVRQGWRVFVTGKHWTASRYIAGDGNDKGLGWSAWNDYETFAVVRNPWDRMVSLYEFIRQRHDKLKPGSFKEWLFSGHNDEPSLCSYLTHDGVFAVQRVIRFENLAEDFAGICDRIGITPRKLETLNATRRKPYQDYYTNETRDYVAKFFAEDIERFEYHFE